MTIEVSCDGCGEEFRIRDEAAGKTFKCKVCGKPVEVPFPDGDLDDGDELPNVDVPKRPKAKKSNSAAEAQAKTMLPAIGLYVVGGIWLMYGLFNIVIVMSGMVPADPPAGANDAARMGHFVGFYGAAFGIPVLTLIVLIGAVCLHTCRSYGMAMVGCVLASLPLCSPCLIFGMPFGIWGLVLLSQDDVKRAFR